MTHSGTNPPFLVWLLNVGLYQELTFSHLALVTAGAASATPNFNRPGDICWITAA
jgi:hypothetical protein